MVMSVPRLADMTKIDGQRGKDEVKGRSGCQGVGSRVTEEQFLLPKEYNNLKPYVKALDKQICDDMTNEDKQGKSGTGNNVVAAVETQEDEPLRKPNGLRLSTSYGGWSYANDWQRKANLITCMGS